MRSTAPLLALLLALVSLGCAAVRPPVSVSPTRVTVTFVRPEAFSDLKDSLLGTWLRQEFGDRS
jgi:hypothetical protein